VCFCDCDGSLDPRQCPLLAQPLLAGRADLILGRRRAHQRGAWPLPARLANLELAAASRVSEIEMTCLPRIGKSTVTGTVRGCVRTVRDMSQVLAL
jgi:hypothetical protein